jgi:hypothetical protein
MLPLSRKYTMTRQHHEQHAPGPAKEADMRGGEIALPGRPFVPKVWLYDQLQRLH